MVRWPELHPASRLVVLLTSPQSHRMLHKHVLATSRHVNARATRQWISCQRPAAQGSVTCHALMHQLQDINGTLT